MPLARARDGTRLHLKDAGRETPVVLIRGWPLLEYEDERHGPLAPAPGRLNRDLLTFIAR